MKTYEIARADAAYYSLLDILYVGDVVSACDTVEDTPSGVTVMYNNDGSFAGAEIPDFVERGYGFDDSIEVDASEPFKLALSGAEVLPKQTVATA